MRPEEQRLIDEAYVALCRARDRCEDGLSIPIIQLLDGTIDLIALRASVPRPVDESKVLRLVR